MDKHNKALGIFKMAWGGVLFSITGLNIYNSYKPFVSNVLRNKIIPTTHGAIMGATIHTSYTHFKNGWHEVV